MSDVIDHARVRSIIIGAIGTCSCLMEAAERGVYVTPARDEAIEIALPMGRRMAQQYRNRMPEDTRVTIRDLEQAGALGVVQAVNRYKPATLYKGKPVRFDTYAYIWIRKYVLEEIADTHWLITCPPRDERERYFKDQMTPEERREYTQLVLSPHATTIDWRDSVDWVSEADWKADVAREAMQK